MALSMNRRWRLLGAESFRKNMRNYIAAAQTAWAEVDENTGNGTGTVREVASRLLR